VSEPEDFVKLCHKFQDWVDESGFSLGDSISIPYGRQWVLGFASEKLKLCLYHGKKGLSLQIQGKESPWKQEISEEIELVFSGLSPKASALAPTASVEVNPDSSLLPSGSRVPASGSDETGKGDWFGPIVCASVYSDPLRDQELLKIGVKDSKALTDKQIPALAQKIRNLDRDGYQVLMLIPAKYNDLYARFNSQGKNLNHLLAWMHATVIRNLHQKKNLIQIAYVDQFAKEDRISPLLKDLSQIEVLQRPGGESNLAVAAASILARSELIRWHEKVALELGYEIPYGAGGKTLAVARKILAQFGEPGLKDFLKMHFKTTAELLGEGAC